MRYLWLSKLSDKEMEKLYNPLDAQFLGGLALSTEKPKPIQTRTAPDYKQLLNLVRPSNLEQEMKEDEPKEGFLMNGIDLMADRFEVAKQLGACPYTELTEDGEEATNWLVTPVFIVPIYNHALDIDWRYWEVFEEAGYLYATDLRTGKVHEVQHATITRKFKFHISPQPLNAKKYEVIDFWFVSNEEIDDPNLIFELLPNIWQMVNEDEDVTTQLGKEVGNWVPALRQKYFEVRLAQINRTEEVIMKVGVEEFRNYLESEYYGKV